MDFNFASEVILIERSKLRVKLCQINTRIAITGRV